MKRIDKKTLMGVFIAAVMILSVLGFALSFRIGGGEKIKYGDYEFVRTQKGLQTRINGQRTIFLYFPGQLTDIPVDDGAKSLLKNPVMLWFSYDPESENAQQIEDAFYYMETKLATLKDVYVQRGLTNTTGYALPRITCANATANVPVLIIKKNNSTKVSATNACVTATAAVREDIYRLADLMLYHAFDVMKE